METDKAISRARQDPDRIHVLGTVVDLILIAAALVVFNAFPDKVGVIRSLTDLSTFTPLLAPEFQNHMPLLNLYWGLAFSLCLANLVMLRWNIGTRSIDLALSILGIVVMLKLALGGPLTVYLWLDYLVKFGLAVAIITAAIDAIRKVQQWQSRWQITVQPR